MQTRVYKLAHTTVADTDNVASVICQQNGFITAVAWAIVALGGAGTGTVEEELSFTPAFQGIVNDTVGPISSCNMGLGNAVDSHENSIIDNIAIPIRAGDRLILNHNATGTNAATLRVQCFVYVSF